MEGTDLMHAWEEEALQTVRKKCRDFWWMGFAAGATVGWIGAVVAAGVIYACNF